MKAFRAALIQLTSTGKVSNNIDKTVSFARKAAKDGVQFIALPENFSWMRLRDSDPPPIFSFEDCSSSSIINDLMELCREFSCYILAGSIPEKVIGDKRHYNTSVLIDPDGNIISKYRKRHIFDVDLADGSVLRESDDIVAGEAAVSVNTPLGIIGHSICYDLRFPEHYRILADEGAEILTVPSAFTSYTGSAHWHVLLRARAIENQCFVIAPNQCGHHGDDRRSYGHSLIVDPWGEVLADAGEGEGVICANIDPQMLVDVRKSLPSLRHRR